MPGGSSTFGDLVWPKYFYLPSHHVEMIGKYNTDALKWCVCWTQCQEINNCIPFDFKILLPLMFPHSSQYFHNYQLSVLECTCNFNGKGTLSWSSSILEYKFAVTVLPPSLHGVKLWHRKKNVKPFYNEKLFTNEKLFSSVVLCRNGWMVELYSAWCPISLAFN